MRVKTYLLLQEHIHPQNKRREVDGADFATPTLTAMSETAIDNTTNSMKAAVQIDAERLSSLQRQQ
jgi:hypothetical protein